MPNDHDPPDGPVGGSELPPEAILRLVEGLPELVGVTDDAGRVIWLNPAARRFYSAMGHDPDRLTTFDMYPPEAFELYYTEVRPAVLRGEPWTGDLPVYDADGSVSKSHQTVVGWRGLGGEVRWLATLSRPIQETRTHTGEVPTGYDELTRLPRRGILREHLAMVRARSRVSGEPYALLFVDLDGFKRVNDHHGHEFGDRVLVRVAERLRKLVRPTDLMARWGGDEFVFVVDRSETAAGSLARRILETLVDPITVDDQTVRLSASIGIAEGDADNEIEDLANTADSAMYHAKLSGGGYSFAHAGLDQEIRRRRSEGRILALSVTRGEIDVLYEPMIALETGRVLAALASSRWRRGEDVMAGETLARTAAAGGVAVALGWQMIRDAVNQSATLFRQLGPSAPVVHLPVLHDQIHDVDFCEGLTGLLSTTELPEHRFCLDVPAGLVLDDSSAVARLLKCLADTGTDFAVTGPDAWRLSSGALPRSPVAVLVAACDLDSVPAAHARSTETDLMADVQLVLTGAVSRDQIDEAEHLGFHLVSGEAVEPATPGSQLADLVLARE
ncbi:MAG: hypothetical protein JJLCMIEE_02841 [Acidimicrobiales bacterium]|nr:MAG: sensor domain-containing diguanylate cyclase [Actinomycetota bacterium]MBV6509743.1 hypothetical protein [Acidimicrobiales bacterium]RIK04863.1 MAG: hypothetical protein DCC48_12555 [Acidobacteriota bacterium]